MRAWWPEYKAKGYTMEEFKAEWSECPMCGELNLNEHMIDTEGRVNGGIGYVCESCVGDL